MNEVNIEELTNMINFAMRIVNAIPEKSLKNLYNAEMKQVINEYNEEVTLLRKALEKYFEKEKKQNLPINLSLHRAYQNLRYL